MVFAVNKKVHILNLIRDETKGENGKVAGGFLHSVVHMLVLFALFCQLLGMERALQGVPWLREWLGLKHAHPRRSHPAAWWLPHLHVFSSP